MHIEIFRKLIDGDEAAFKSLFDLYYKQLAGFANRYVRDGELAKDVAQNVFIKLYQQRTQLADVREIKPYLFRMVHNECLNEIKKSDTRSQHHQLYAAYDLEYEANLEQSDKEYQIFQMIERLPPRCKEIFLMSRIEGKKNAEIAETLNLSLRTVETQISIALKTLRNSLLVLSSFLKFF